MITLYGELQHRLGIVITFVQSQSEGAMANGLH